MLIEVGELRNDPRYLGFAQWLLGFMAIVEERYDDAVSFGRKTCEISVTSYDTDSGILVEAMGLTLSGRADEGFAAVESYRRAALARNDNYGLMGADPVYAVGLALRGKPRQGIQWLEDSIRRAEDTGSPVAADWARLTLGDLYVEMLTSKQRPPLAFVVRNIGFLLAIKFQGPGRALAAYERVLRNPQIGKSGVLAARAHAGMGAIHKLQKRSDLARQHLTIARTLCEGLGGAPISLKIRRLLDDLGPG
jgi:hypothetical protein